MKNTSLTATIAAIVCAGMPLAAVAQSTSEVFAPNVDADSVIYHDGHDEETGVFAGLSYEVVKGHAIAEGDIVLGVVGLDGNIIGEFSRGLGQARIFDRWPNGVIPYQYSSETSEEERELADQAIEQWNQNTSIMMVELNDENRSDFGSFLTFESSNGCASYVGMRGGEQQLWISTSCGVGSIIHEIGHAVGLFHEHTRSDRDNFIEVNQDNIVAGKEFNFDVLIANTELFGEYDYGSIMHYGETFFSSNGSPTITPLAGQEIGQRIALSDGDIISANDMYRTDLSLNVNARDEVDDDQIVVDVQVTNEGEMGANQLSLSMEVDGGASWLSISPDSGWECLVNGTALQCERSALDASASSLFTVVAEANGATANQVSAEIIANTRESDYGNNGYNVRVEAPQTPSVTESVASNETVQDSVIDSQPPSLNQEEPAIGAATTDNSTADSEPGTPLAALPELGQTTQISTDATVDASDVDVVASTGAPSGASGVDTSTPTDSALDTNLGSDQTPEASSGGGGGAMSPLTGFGLFLAMIGLRLGRRTRK